MVMVDGEEGHRVILDSLDYFKLVKAERVRFFSLVDVLWSDATDLAFKRDVLLFMNTLINSSSDLEERIEIRADMVISCRLLSPEKADIDIFAGQLCRFTAVSSRHSRN